VELGRIEALKRMGIEYFDYLGVLRTKTKQKKLTAILSGQGVDRSGLFPDFFNKTFRQRKGY